MTVQRTSSKTPARVRLTSSAPAADKKPATAPDAHSDPGAVFDATTDRASHRSRNAPASALHTQAHAAQTPVPKLMADWHAALLDTEATLAARAEFAPQVETALRDAAADKDRAMRGVPLTRQETAGVVKGVYGVHKAGLKIAHAAYLAEYQQNPQATQRDVVLNWRRVVDQKRDPFTPIADNDPQARAREIVLWENASVMVLVDGFSPAAKALVVPKTPAMFPTDMSAALMQELAVVAAHVSDAFVAAGAQAPSDIWINPPQSLTVKQLHVHVAPGLPDFELDGQHQMTPAAVQAFSSLCSDVTATLAARLGV
jgi:diadenosine tetraphosphate (Ap4A) HIT family hydrolase